MIDTPKPLSAAVIHSIYAGAKVSSVVDNAKDFQSTNRFARDSAHSGHAPEKPAVEKKRSDKPRT
jgi:hypothetical protein